MEVNRKALETNVAFSVGFCLDNVKCLSVCRYKDEIGEYYYLHEDFLKIPIKNWSFVIVVLKFFARSL